MSSKSSVSREKEKPISVARIGPLGSMGRFGACDLALRPSGPGAIGVADPRVGVQTVFPRCAAGAPS